MPATVPGLRRGPVERLRAWIVTGPLGHLYSTVADLAVFAAGSLLTRARQWLRLRGGR
jgi:hypothetical protein